MLLTEFHTPYINYFELLSDRLPLYILVTKRLRVHKTLWLNDSRDGKTQQKGNLTDTVMLVIITTRTYTHIPALLQRERERESE